MSLTRKISAVRWTHGGDAIVHDVGRDHDSDDRGIPFQGDVVLEHTVNAVFRGQFEARSPTALRMIDDPAFVLVDTHHVEAAMQLFSPHFPMAVCISDRHCQGIYFRMCWILCKSEHGRCKEEALVIGVCSQ